MTKRNRGTALIINNEYFFGCNFKNREGSNHDEDNLKKLFERLHFTPVVISNLSAEVGILCLNIMFLGCEIFKILILFLQNKIHFVPIYLISSVSTSLNVCVSHRFKYMFYEWIQKYNVMPHVLILISSAHKRGNWKGSGRRKSLERRCIYSIYNVPWFSRSGVR